MNASKTMSQSRQRSEHFIESRTCESSNVSMYSKYDMYTAGNFKGKIFSESSLVLSQVNFLTPQMTDKIDKVYP